MFCCVYAFLGIITLVTVMNIMNSISMSVSARIKQYGSMRAVGMDGRQLSKMILAEAFTYAFWGCFIGCAIGLPFSKMMYDFPLYHKPITLMRPGALPVGSLAVIVLFVIVAALLAAYSPAKRINNLGDGNHQRTVTAVMSRYKHREKRAMRTLRKTIFRLLLLAVVAAVMAGCVLIGRGHQMYQAALTQAKS